MKRVAHRAALLGSLIAVLVGLALVTLRTTQPASITLALARGQAPEAPDFTLPRLDAPGVLGLRSLRGEAVVLNFWASWCLPCREESSLLEETWKRYRDLGVVVVGVDVQDLTDEAIRFLKETRTTYPQVRDRDNAVYRSYGLTGVPETFFVNRRGRIVRKFPGAVTRPEDWFKAVEETLERS